MGQAFHLAFHLGWVGRQGNTKDIVLSLQGFGPHCVQELVFIHRCGRDVNEMCVLAGGREREGEYVCKENVQCTLVGKP